MPEQLPHNFAYHQYPQKLVGATHPDRPFFSANEADFAKSGGIGFPYRSYFYALGMLHEGQCRIRIGLEKYVLGKQSMTLVGPGIVRHWLENNWQVKNNTFFFTQDLFARAFKPGFLLEYPFFQPGAQHVLQLSDQEYEELQPDVGPGAGGIEECSTSSGSCILVHPITEISLFRVFLRVASLIWKRYALVS